MSISNLGRQFEQLAMFMPVKDIIDNVHKIDSPYHPEWGGSWSPREQWERRPQKVWGEGISLREEKASEVKDDLIEHVRRGTSKPLAIHHDDRRGIKTLVDGHHHLATYEELGHQEVPVTHRSGDVQVWGSSQPDVYEAPPVPDFVKVSRRSRRS